MTAIFFLFILRNTKKEERERNRVRERQRGEKYIQIEIDRY